MVLTTKKICGHKYYYYQDNIRVENKNKIITTFVSSVDLSYKELMEARITAFIKHINNLLKAYSILNDSPYHFEYRPTSQLESHLFSIIMLIYQYIQRSLPQQELEEFKKTVFIKYVHGTTAIEGNTLSEGETYTLLIDDLTPKNKSANEINEVSNYKRVKAYLDNYSGDVNERLIKKIHTILVNNITDSTGKLYELGKYRTTEVSIRGVFHSLSRADKIEEDISKLLEWYSEGVQRRIHPIELAAVFHQKFELIHPFRDYNGRTGREILNFMLGRSRFPPIYITRLHRSEYLNALREGDLSNYIPIVNFIIERILSAMVYLFSKTSLFEELQSEDFKGHMTLIYGEEISKMFITTLNKFNESNEIP